MQYSYKKPLGINLLIFYILVLRRLLSITSNNRLWSHPKLGVDLNSLVQRAPPSRFFVGGAGYSLGLAKLQK